MAKITWNISNITCATCAHTISRSLETHAQKNIEVSIASGRVAFDHNQNVSEQMLQKEIEQLGYHFSSSSTITKKTAWWTKLSHRLVISFLFTLPLLLHMFVHIDWLMNPLVQFFFALPVYFLGLLSFGKSAFRSIKNNAPNMDVLIIVGASAAFIYSLVGCFILNDTTYLFFETTASIFTLVLFGNWLEHRSAEFTQRAVKRLISAQSTKATMIAFDDQYAEQFLEVAIADLRVGDLILVKSGEVVPADAKILSGQACFNESVITGESAGVWKQNKDNIIGGSIIEEGNVKAQITAVGDLSVLGKIIQSVREAEAEKAPVQLLADKISAVFVPLVLFIAGITFLGNYFFAEYLFETALMRTIAVLVIACPCALGLATPAAIAVGLGRGAKYGILFRQAKILERCKHIRQIVFDKTGTLTTGKLRIKNFSCNDIGTEYFKQLVTSIEKFSTHPIAHSIVQEWQQEKYLPLKNIQEIKGIGMTAQDDEGNVYEIGSEKMNPHRAANMPPHQSIYVFKNKKNIGWIDLEDELRPEAKSVIQNLQEKNIRVYLISGDNELKCKQVAQQLGIEHYHASQSPEQKIKWIEQLEKNAPTAMVGDGINDAPALAKASIGISINGASQISIEAASIVLMNSNLSHVITALELGTHTYRTIQENLFWAFSYNIIAIPVAAFGFLSPTFGALMMGASDVVLALNSGRLYIKKIHSAS